MLYQFSHLRSPELKNLVKKNPLAILPVGQIEEHGSHLPIATDCVIAAEAARAIAGRLGKKIPVLLMETISYGYSGKIMTSWAGTMQVKMDTIRDYCYDVCASIADMGVKKIAVINGHGHHTAILELVARRLADEKNVAPAIITPWLLIGDVIAKASKAGPEGSCHAGEFETSLMLYLAGELVEMSKAANEPVSQRLKPPSGIFWSTWERQKTSSGIYGKPSVASAESGKVFFEAIVTRASNFLEEHYIPEPRGGKKSRRG